MSDETQPSISRSTARHRLPAAGRPRARRHAGSAATAPTCSAPRPRRSTHGPQRTGHAFLRHDYSGHGESGGAFRDGTISRWLARASPCSALRRRPADPGRLVDGRLDRAAHGRRNLRKAGEGGRVAGLVLLAPAPDFTIELVEPKLTRSSRSATSPTKGYFEEPSEYSPRAQHLHARADRGRPRNRVMTGPIDTHCPVHILQGMRRSRRALRPCAEAGQPPAGRRRDAVAGPGRRPPPVAAAGPRR